mmetsp:Transcript_1744/g.2423  ORF Transcript_1744/g.2423 Transcript_1744/m.2423 type:complete len:367 (-) Transcript_1744:115-1215(-)
MFATMANTMVRGWLLVHVVSFLILFSASSATAFSLGMSSSMSMSTRMVPRPRGAAATPAQKKKVAVFGSGGYMGATAFGFLQRASSLYGTGLGGVSSPRSICATAAASAALNKVLSKNFVLSYAGEDMVRLTDMQDSNMIGQRLSGYKAVIMGTLYQLEELPVTGNSYETSPNDKTWEFYLDNKNTVETLDVDLETHLSIFKNTLDGCKQAGIEHIVILETPQTQDAKPFAELLDKSGLQFTYIHSLSELDTFQDYTYFKGVQGDLDIQSFTFAQGYTTADGYNAGDWMDALADTRREEGAGTIFREDLAALAVQCLQSLDWSTSRCLEVSCTAPLENARTVAGSRPDKEWCVNSNSLAEKLGPVQ